MKLAGPNTLRSAAAAIILTVLAPAVPASAAPTVPPVTVVCDIFAARIPVPVDRVQPYLADGFAPQAAAGVTYIQPVAARCSLRTDGRPAGAMDYSVVSVDLSSHRGSYDMWEVSDSPLWHSVNTEVGKFSPFVQGTTYDVSRDLVTGEPLRAHQDVPWSRSRYTMDATVLPAAAAAPRDLHFPSRHWYGGPHGDVLRTDDNFGITAYAAVVTVDAEPGGDLAEIIGDEPITLPGAYLRFEAVDTWEVVEP